MDESLSKKMTLTWHLPLRSLHGLIFLLVAVIFFTVALIFKILPLLLLSAFMIALVVMLILLLLFLYPLVLSQVKGLSLSLKVDSSTHHLDLSLVFPRQLHNFLLFMYNIQCVWHQSPSKEYQNICSLSSRKNFVLRKNLPSRGIYKLSITLQFMDIFGLFTIAFPLKYIEKIIVPAPPVSTLKDEELILSYMSTITGGSKQYQQRIESQEFYDFKPYVRGDDIRNIDWHLYARFHDLYVKNRYQYQAMNPTGFHIQIVLPKEGKKDEEILEKLIQFTQQLAHSLVTSLHRNTQLHVHDHFSIQHFDGNSLACRKKLAYISTAMPTPTHGNSNRPYIYVISHDDFGHYSLLLEKTASHIFIVTPKDHPSITKERAGVTIVPY